MQAGTKTGPAICARRKYKQGWFAVTLFVDQRPTGIWLEGRKFQALNLEISARRPPHDLHVNVTYAWLARRELSAPLATLIPRAAAPLSTPLADKSAGTPTDPGRERGGASLSQK